MIRLGIIGTGGMANAHAKSYQPMKGLSLTACCDIDEKRAREFSERWSIPRWYTDYREMLGAETLDAVDVVTVDAAHAPVTLAAIGKGLSVMCEKPLATSLADARKMRDAAKKRGVLTMVNFSYRNSSGAQAASQLIRDGGIGRVIHVESSYLQSWLAQNAWGDWRTQTGMTWRLSTRHGSAGVLGDIGCHIYDLTALLCGDIAEITCLLSTFDKGIKGNRIGEYVLDANDSFVSTIRLAGGGLGTVHSSRWATGHLNSLRVRVYGDRGAIEVDLDRSYTSYRICRGANLKKAQWNEVSCKRTPTQYERFIHVLKTGKPDVNDFANGAKVQAYLDASLRSDETRQPVRVKL
ncbi:MAG TPA: Gfo/Idh/MocA family oxidoreductase [Spirochaetia bacterium]|nr:Gfo/Idh/MocA family oxidoreductase [Spirochaetia bacterium]